MTSCLEYCRIVDLVIIYYRAMIIRNFLLTEKFLFLMRLVTCESDDWDGVVVGA